MSIRIMSLVWENFTAGGTEKLAMLLGFKGKGGAMRVQNWKTRGIPARVKVNHPELFLRKFRK